MPMFLSPCPNRPPNPFDRKGTGLCGRGSGTPCDGHWSHVHWGRRILITSVQSLLGMVNKFPQKLKKKHTQMWV